MLFSEKTRDFGNHVYFPESPSYSLAVSHSNGFHYGNWTQCRDTFQQVASFQSLRSNGMFYIVGGGSTKASEARVISVAKFIRKIEERLKFKEFSSFGKTSFPSGLFIKPVDFWTEDKLKLSLLTLLLRCGLKYREGKSFRKVFSQTPLARSTYPAIERFLRGFVFYEKLEVLKYGGHRGWHWAFRGKKLEEVRALLKKV
jgi:hypothetical protein